MKNYILTLLIIGQSLVSTAFAIDGTVQFHGIVEPYKILSIKSCELTPGSTYQVRDTSLPYGLNHGPRDVLIIDTKGTDLGIVAADSEGCVTAIYKMPLGQAFGSRVVEYKDLTSSQLSTRKIESKFE